MLLMWLGQPVRFINALLHVGHQFIQRVEQKVGRMAGFQLSPGALDSVQVRTNSTAQLSAIFIVVYLETEITFLLIHYSQLKKTIKNCTESFLLVDFSIDKDLVYARLNLNNKELMVFENIYNHVIQEVGISHAVIYIDLSLEMLRKRLFQRGRPYEIKTDLKYFKGYNDKVKEYFKNEAKSKAYFFEVDDLNLDPGNEKLKQIRNTILYILKREAL